jgi:RNA polymerase sigma factor (sigma-70 family)
MDERGIASVLAYFRRQAVPGAEVAPDYELLRQFVETGSEAAFETLVRRHGPMVYGVARRVLRNGHAAEDAFQATFLALARKARSLRSRTAVGGWLYRVALRAALRAKPQEAIRRTPRASADPAVDAEWSELRAVLDEEIDKLPDRCRLAVIACYLRGRTADEAAKEFGCPRGTVLSRLAAAREKLRYGLTRRGYAISVAGLTAGLTGEATSAALPSTLVALALKTALPGAVLAPTVVTLAQGVMHAMWITKVKGAVISLAAVGLLGVGAGQYCGPGLVAAIAPQAQIPVVQQPKPAPPPAPVTKNEPEPINRFDGIEKEIEFVKSDTPARTLMADCFQAVTREVELRYQEFTKGRGTLDILFGAAARFRDSGLERAANKEARIKVLERYAALTNDIMNLNKERMLVGSIKEQDYLQTQYYQLDALLRLMRERESKPTTGR